MATHALQHPSQQPRTTSEPFLKIPHTHLRATVFVSRTTGESISLTPASKLVWAWMKCCHDSYTGKGNTYHESQASIAGACGVSVDSVKRAMTLFEKHGYLIKKRTRMGSIWSLPYELGITCTAKAESNPAPAVVAVAVSAANDDAELDALLGPARSYSAPQEQNGASACTPDVADEYAAMPVEWWESGLPPEGSKSHGVGQDALAR